MFTAKLATFYGVLLIAATDAFPGRKYQQRGKIFLGNKTDLSSGAVIPNRPRQGPPVGDTQPIQLSSAHGGMTSFPAAHTVSPLVQADLSTPTTPVPVLTPLATTNQPDTIDASGRVLTTGTPTATNDAKGRTRR